ncbi:hypothetical protein [Nocardioides daeguensis]|uniref:Sulfotransferase family protein n=1 Tax=Nocardioides daeguensis TaxID=908359 RepID=A0ABP6WD91_9ACTN|nr:hypothetical protein [Nocardioides daeguensis]MBV6729630.1 hypothetical protein [Nocardioides daeguensis]MCR1775062.1 hypothetical protein [Nocardioides daeguensis]
MTASLPLPAGARILHVGPPKTGTTALQSSLHQARAELEEQGVHYLSRGRHDASAARWITRRPVLGSDLVKAEQRWERIASDLRAPSTARRLFSSEFLSDATDDQVDEILTRIGHSDLWAVLTLRPLARILSSQYQQTLQSGGRREYDEWLRSLFTPEHTRPAPRQFWLRHRHDALARRWAERIGPEKVIVVVLDPVDRDFLPRTFEQILGLTARTLTAKPALENRSLTAAEAEVIRRFNVQYRRAGLRPESQARMLIDIGNHLKQRTPHDDEPRIVTPDWALSRANEVAAEMAANIGALGVDVRGDLAQLSAVPLTGARETTVPGTVDPELAADVAIGVATAIQRLGTAAPQLPATPPRRLARWARRRG